MPYTLVTNRHTRMLYSWNELPSNEIRKEFNYIVDSEMREFGSVDGIDDYKRFFNYRGSWYDYYEFEVASHDVKRLGFDGMQPQSYFDAIVVSYFDKAGYELEDCIIVGHLHW